MLGLLERKYSMKTQRQPDTLLSTLHVPEQQDDYDELVHTIIGRIDDEGNLTIAGDYTDEQKQAIVAYFTFNNEHLRIRRGASLGVMGEEESRLYDAAIESLKSTFQKLRERVEKLLLSNYQCEDGWEARMSGYEEQENYRYWIEEYRREPEQNQFVAHLDEWEREGLLPEGTRLFECTLREGYGEWYLNRRYRQPLRDTKYWVTLSPSCDLTIIHSIKNERSWKRSEEED